MRVATIWLVVGAIAMLMSITYALAWGDLFGEAAVLFEYPWFHVSMIDLYTGFMLFSGWIVYRERSPYVACLWVLSVLLLGNLASCVYGLVAAAESKGEWRAFWMGSRSGRSQRTA